MSPAGKPPSDHLPPRPSPRTEHDPIAPLAPARSRTILITAGPTREYVDPVRYLSNDSSGQMGLALAGAAAARGHVVHLVHGPISLRSPANCTAHAVTSAQDMLEVCQRLWSRCEVLIMAAAVADYRPARPSAVKLKKQPQPMTLQLEPTPDVLATLSAMRGPGQVVIGFALEDVDARTRAADKLRRKNLDAIVLNSPAAIGAEQSRVEVLEAAGEWQALAMGAKSNTALRIIEIAERLASRYP